MESSERETKSGAGKAPGKRLRMIGREPLEAALDLAVSRALRRTSARYDAGHVGAVQDIVRAEFKRLLASNAKTVRGVGRTEFLAELERSRNQVLAARDQAREELEEVQERLAFLRGLFEDGDGEAEGGAAPAFEGAFERPFLRVLQGSTVPAMARQRIARELAEEARGIARAEWARATERRRERARERIERYERRIAKLMRSMERTEEALDRLASLREEDGGVRSIYRVVQGLAEDEVFFEKKQRMLREVFAANVLLQKEGRRRP